MSQIAEQKCPACGAPLRFDPASGMLVCDYCGTKTELPKAKDSQEKKETGREKEKPAKADNKAEDDEIGGFDFDSLDDLVTDPNAMNLPVYNCVSCGAEVIAPPEQMALTCPYCGNNIVLTQKVTGKLRPDGVIPFRIHAKDLPAAVNNFYKDKKLLPRHFFSESTMGKVTGVYVPFWVFSGDVKGAVTILSHRPITTSWCATQPLPLTISLSTQAAGSKTVSWIPSSPSIPPRQSLLTCGIWQVSRQTVSTRKRTIYPHVPPAE